MKSPFTRLTILNTSLESNQWTSNISRISLSYLIQHSCSFQSISLQEQKRLSVPPLEDLLIEIIAALVGVIAVLVGPLVLLTHYQIDFPTLATYHYLLIGNLDLLPAETFLIAVIYRRMILILIYPLDLKVL